MSQSANLDLEQFVWESCDELGIPVKRTSHAEIKIAVPPKYRGAFGNLEAVHLTSSKELRRMDPGLEYLGPGSFVVEALSRLLEGSSVPVGRVIAGVPRRVEPDEYREAFESAHMPQKSGEEHNPGRLPSGFRIASIDSSDHFRPYLRLVAEVRAAAQLPVHEVVPIYFDLEERSVLACAPFVDRHFYDVDEVSRVLASPPADPGEPAIEFGLRKSLEELRRTIGRLAFQAQGSLRETLRVEEQELQAFYSSASLDCDYEARAELEEEFERKRDELQARMRVELYAEPVSLTIIHALIPLLRVTIEDRYGEPHDIVVPTIPGRPDIPKDTVRCGHADRPLVVVPGKGLACVDCTPACQECGIGTPSSASACAVCEDDGQATCATCAIEVEGTTACEAHTYTCVSGEQRIAGDEGCCSSCGRTVCADRDHRFRCGCGDDFYCSECRDAQLSACSGCGAEACANHSHRDAQDRTICPSCECVCSVDGGVHLAEDGAVCTPCVQEGMEFTCHEHLVDVQCVHERCCSSHVVRSNRDSTTVCESCSEECTVCEQRVPISDGLVCTVTDCENFVCRDHESELACAVNGHPMCRSHRRACEITEDDVCTDHLQECDSCGTRHRVDLASVLDADFECRACGRGTCTKCVKELGDGQIVCEECYGTCAKDGAGVMRKLMDSCWCHDMNGARFCQEHLERAPCCRQRTCERHLFDSVESDLKVCKGCARRCYNCEGILAPSDGASCKICKKTFCKKHTVTSPKSGRVVCQYHAGESPLHWGKYPEDELKACTFCGIVAVMKGGLCDLCQCFSAKKATDPLPFDRELIEPFVKVNAGLLRSRAEVFWAVGERHVLVWVRSGILKTGAIAYFDHEGRRVKLKTPRRPTCM